MSYPRSYDALILLTRDIGEADRLCILFTREAGRKALRARAVRKTGSKLGGMLLPLRRVHIDVQEHVGGGIITSAVDGENTVPDWSQLPLFTQVMQGIELLLRLTEDDEPLPTVFDLLLEMRDACSGGQPDPVLPFQLRLLQLLGLLPVTTEDTRVADLSMLGKTFLWSCAHGRPLVDLCALPYDQREMRSFSSAVLLDHLKRPLQAVRVAEAMS